MAKVINCNNYAEVIGNNSIGGIFWYTLSSKISIENCNNYGKITGTSNVGQVVGRMDSTCIEKMYYLFVTDIRGIGNIADNKAVVDGKQIVEGKTEQQLKSKEFLDLLNGEHKHIMLDETTELDYTGKCWVEDTNNINSGYPIFSYQVEE